MKTAKELGFIPEYKPMNEEQSRLFISIMLEIQAMKIEIMKVKMKALSLAKTDKEKLQILRKWGDILGEDFYPGQGEEFEKANEVVTDLIERGLLRFEDKNLPEGLILLVH